MKYHFPKEACYEQCSSPVGELLIVATEQGLHSILWDIEKKDADVKKACSQLKRDDQHKIIVQTKKQLTEYFSGKRQNFELPLDLQGSPFQVRVWKQLMKIPYSRTLSYGDLAKKLGDKNKARAVGMANSKNKLPIIIPCHRVVAADGSLGGFTGGLNKKTYLLNLEQK